MIQDLQENVLSRVLSVLLFPTLLRPHGLLCPWNCPGKNTTVSCHFLLQGIFMTQGSNLPLLEKKSDGFKHKQF